MARKKRQSAAIPFLSRHMGCGPGRRSTGHCAMGRLIKQVIARSRRGILQTAVNARLEPWRNQLKTRRLAHFSELYKWPRQTRHILRELCPRGFEARKPTRSSTRAFFTIYDIDAELCGRRFSPASRRIARGRAYLATDRRIIRGGRRKAKRQHAQGFWRGWSKLCSGLPLGWS